MRTMKDGEHCPGLKGHQPFAYVVTDAFAFFIALARLSDQNINDISSTSEQNRTRNTSEKTIKVRP